MIVFTVMELYTEANRFLLGYCFLTQETTKKDTKNRASNEIILEATIFCLIK